MAHESPCVHIINGQMRDFHVLAIPAGRRDAAYALSALLAADRDSAGRSRLRGDTAATIGWT
jgi:hypothetical protein